MRHPWSGVVWRLLGLLLVCALLGMLSGQFWPALFIGTLGYLIAHLVQLYRLERWLREGSLAECPRPAGIWGEVFYRVLRLKKRSRKRKRKLARLLNQFQEAAATLPDAAVVLGKRDEILWFNEAARRLLGLQASHDIGQPITHLVRHPRFVRFLTQGSYGDSIIFPSPLDDALPLSVRIIPYSQEQRLLLATDVSRVQRLERMRQDFVSNASHELRTPLTVISGYLETLLDDADSCAAKWNQPLRRMQQQSQRMLHIIEDLLMLARLETQSGPPPELLPPVAVPTMLAVIAEDARTLSGEQGHEIRMEADPNLWLRGSEQELRSAFSNLVFNAVRYTPDQGRIIIRWFADAEWMHLQVEDNGEGIAPRHIPRLTERFYRVDRGRHREKGGTGLGLAIVKHVLNRHHAQLRISSELGVGSSFNCDFPLQLRVEKGARPENCQEKAILNRD